MQMDRFARLQQIFEDALALGAEERPAFVKQLTADDPSLEAEVLAMLQVEQAGDGLHTDRLRRSALGHIDAMARDRAIGRRIGRYELVGELGSGGMGRVYKARRVEGEVEQWVALKVVRAELLNPSLIERFSNERKMLARLNHPGIAHFIDADGDADGTAFVAMELVDGEPLLRHVQGNHCDLQQRLELFRQLLAAVAHAHRALIIHRDIKPANVFVRSDGVVKLLDFGIAKAINVQAAHTQTHDRAFTPLSAAPEQLRGEPCDVTTDVYALGLVLYELIAGRPPFDAEGLSTGELERLVLSVPPPPMRTRNTQATARSIPADLENIVAKALRKEQSLRYASVEQFDADVSRFIANEPVSVSGNSRWYRLRKFMGRHALASAFAGLAATAVIAALLVAWTQAQSIRAERDRANAALSVLTDAFAAADPSGLAGGEVTARQILANSAASIAPLAERDAASYIRLATAIAKVELTLGMSKAAADLLRNAVGMEAAAGTEERAEARVLLARAATEQNIVSEAKRVLAGLDADRRGHADARLVDGRIAIKLREWPTAERIFARLASELSPPQQDWMLANEQWAGAISEQGRHDESLAVLANAEAKVVALRGSGHPASARLRIARIEALNIAGRREQAIELGLPLMAELRKQFGEQSSLTGVVASELAMAYHASADYAKAAEFFADSTRMFEASLGRLHPHTYRMRFSWASVLRRVPGQERVMEEQMAAALQDAIDDVPPSREVVNFFRLELSKARARAKTPEALRAALLTIAPAEMKSVVADVIPDNRKKTAEWTNYYFWSNKCASSADEKAMTAGNACAAADVKPECVPAQELLCGLTQALAETPSASTP